MGECRDCMWSAGLSLQICIITSICGRIYVLRRTFVTNLCLSAEVSFTYQYQDMKRDIRCPKYCLLTNRRIRLEPNITMSEVSLTYQYQDMERDIRCPKYRLLTNRTIRREPNITMSEVSLAYLYQDNKRDIQCPKYRLLTNRTI